MSSKGRIETIAVAVMAMLFLVFFGYISWAEATADAIILHDDGRSYACQTSRISPTPHNCKPVKDRNGKEPKNDD